MVGNLAPKLPLVKTQPKVADLPNKDIKWCTVTLSDVINGGKRLEASVYEIGGRQARESILNCKYPQNMLCGVDGVASAYTGTRFKRIWMKHSEYPIFQPSSIMDIKPKPDGFISSATDTDISKLRVKKGQILITCSGTIGKVSLVSKTLNNHVFSHDLIRLDVKNPADVGFVYAFLRSKIGNVLLQSNSYGAVITHIEPEHLLSVPIPNPPALIKAKIGNLIMESFYLRDESNDLIDRANQLLTDELKFPSIDEFDTRNFNKLSKVDNYVVRLSELSGRFDGSYHVPIVKAITEHLERYAGEVTVVGNDRISKRIILPGRFKRFYVEEGQGRVFFGGKQLYELDPSNKKYLSIGHHEERIIKQLELQQDMTLITCSGTIGKVTLVPKHWEGWTANQHIIRVVPANKGIAGYLSIFLSSIYGYELIKRYTYGSVVDEIDDRHVAQIPFPLLKNKILQEEINNLALKANELRYKAYRSEQKALRIMDEDVIFAKNHL